MLLRSACHIKPIHLLQFLEPLLINFKSIFSSARKLAQNRLPSRQIDAFAHHFLICFAQLLTYMATLDDLMAQGTLVALEVPLEPHQQAWRRLYALPRFVEWLDNDLPNLECSWCNSDPKEQLGALFISYVLGEPLLYERQFREIWPVRNGVWELKTTLLRIFGWFVAQDRFICTYGNLADHVKDYDLYHGYMNETVRERRDLSLDQPDYVAGVDYNVVLSNAPDG